MYILNIILYIIAAIGAIAAAAYFFMRRDPEPQTAADVGRQQSSQPEPEPTPDPTGPINDQIDDAVDEELIEKCAKTYKHIITIEENVITGGAGSAVNEYLAKIGYSEKLKIFGIPDEFPIVGSQENQRDAAGLTKDKILESLARELNLKDLEKKVSAQ